MIKKLLSFLLIFSLIFICGCTGYTESDNRLIVSAMGFDKEDGNFSLYLQTVTVNEAESELKEQTYEATGKTVEDTLFSLKSKIYKPLSFEHCSAVILSTRLLKNDIKEIIRFCKKIQGLNTSVYFAAADDTEKILHLTAVSEAAGGYDISSAIESKDEDMGIRYKNRLYELLSSEDQFIPTAYLPFLNITKDKFYIDGERVYIDFSPKEKLSPDESFILSVLTNRYRKGNITLNGETAQIQDSHTYFSARINGGKLYIELKTEFRFKNRSENFLEQFNLSAQNILSRKEDIFNFSEVLRQKFPKVFAAVKPSYNEIYSAAAISYKAEEELF